MKIAKMMFVAATAFAVSAMVLASAAEAANRKYSHRVGGYNSHGKGSHYVGGYRKHR